MTPPTTPTAKLTIGYDPAEVAALAALHVEAEKSYPNPPAPALLASIGEAESALAEAANDQIRAFATTLRARGARAWFEVWYPKTTLDDFDAVEVAEDGTISTVPPYSELGA